MGSDKLPFRERFRHFREKSSSRLKPSRLSLSASPARSESHTPEPPTNVSEGALPPLVDGAISRQSDVNVQNAPEQISTGSTGDNVASRIPSIWEEAFNDLDKETVARLLQACPNFEQNGANGKISFKAGKDDFASEIAGKVTEARKIREAKHQGLRKGYETAIRILDSAKGIIAGAASLNPYAGAAWTAASAILPLLLVSSEENQAAMTLLGEILHVTEIYRWHEIDHSQHQNFRDMAKKVYIHILECEDKLYTQFCERKLMPRWGHNLIDKGGWSEALEKLKDLDRKCNDIVEIIRKHAVVEWRKNENNQRSAIKNKIQAFLNEMQDQELMSQIRRLDKGYLKAKNDQNPDRISGTCQWFLRHIDFLDWRASDERSLLWVSADPGCGKSVLSKSLLDCNGSILTTGHRSRRIVCYFFFKDGYDNQMDPSIAIGAFIHQLVLQEPKLSIYMKEVRAHSDDSLWDFELLWDLFLEMTENPMLNGAEIICLMDALDECQELSAMKSSRRYLVKQLTEYFDERNTMHRALLKMIVTSRPTVEIEAEFRDFEERFPRIRLRGEEESDIIEQEIKLVIKSKVKEIGPVIGLSNEISRNKLEKALLKVENKTYLWLYLILDYLQFEDNNRRRKFSSEAELTAALAHLPDGINKTYEAMLERSTNSGLARKLLHIVLAARRVFTVEETFTALKMDETKTSYDSLDDGFLERSPSELKNICGLLVRVADNRIYLLHQTVREFLVQSPDSSIQRAPSSWKSNCRQMKWSKSFSYEESHLVLTRVCLQLFLFVDGQHTEKLRRLASHMHHRLFDTSSSSDVFPLLTYAVDSGPYHLSQSQDLISDGEWNVICHKGFLSPLYGDAFRGVQENIIRFDLSNGLQYLRETRNSILDPMDKKTWIYRGVKENAKRVLNYVLQNLFTFPNDITLFLTDTSEITLYQDCINSHHAAFTMLLSHSLAWAHIVDSPTYAGPGRTVLSAVIQGLKDDKPLLEKVLEHLSHCDCPEPLQAIMIAHRGRCIPPNEPIVDVIHDRYESEPLLIQAVRRKRKSILHFLLDLEGSKVDARSSTGRTALMYAIQSQKSDFVKILINKGADIFAEDEYGSSVFHTACKNGTKRLVEHLLESGVFASKTNLAKWSALHFAAAGNQFEIAELLLFRGADVNALNEKGESPLFEAINNNSIETVKVLLTHGAKVDIVSGWGGTPLTLALESSPPEIVKLLENVLEG